MTKILLAKFLNKSKKWIHNDSDAGKYRSFMIFPLENDIKNDIHSLKMDTKVKFFKVVSSQKVQTSH